MTQTNCTWAVPHNCDFGCGFVGTFEEVLNHEASCPARPTHAVEQPMGSAEEAETAAEREVFISFMLRRES